MRVGLGVSEDLAYDRQQRLALEVEHAGLASLWTNEARGRDALTVCLAWAQTTEDLLVGTGIVPVWSRTPAQLAMSAASVQEASRGRLLLGIGVSHGATMDAWHGAEWRQPVPAAIDTLSILAAALGGERTQREGEVFSSRGFELGISPPPAVPPLYLAAMGPRMLEVAGSHADGVLLNWSCPEEVDRAASRVRQAADAGPGGDGPDVAAYVRVAVARDRDAARTALAREFTRYLALDAYARHVERQGFGEVVDAAKRAYRGDGPEAAARSVPEDVLREFGWWGTSSDDAVETLRRYAEAGLDHLVARVVVVDDDIEASVRAALESISAAAGVARTP